MKCPKCQHENPDDAKFCNECANKLELICPACKKSNPPGSKYCNECAHNLTTASSEPESKEPSFDEKLDKIQRYLPKGVIEKILSQRDRIEGERKLVTVLFCDMEGFTALSEKLDPEEAYSIMDQVYEILIHKVHDYEGTVNEMTGDGIMALFGAPIALEDAPQRAIRSANAIHREIAKFSDRIRQEREDIAVLKMRIGIHTGPVVVGTLGNDLRVEFKAVGDTVNLASRVEGLADPGATYVTEDTFKLTEGFFRFEALGEKEIKGKEKPIKVYRVIAVSTRRTRFDVSAERGLTPFVGRERELEFLVDSFERAKGGQGQAFSIVAEAGIGKSRLLYEFRKAVASEDMLFLEGRCLSYSGGVAYHPVVDILKAGFDIREGDGDSKIREKVKRGLKILEIDEVSTLPYLLELFSVKESGIEKISMSPEARKNQMIEVIKLINLKSSENRLLITAYEDLHWADKSSEEVLKYILESIPGARVLMIFTYRPGFVHTWGGKSYHNQVNLNRLSNRESLTMVTNLLNSEDIDSDLEDLILKKTEGVPFYIEEFARSLNDLNIIERKDNKCHLAKDIQDVAIPSTIQDVIMARVDSLSEETKSLLQTASVVGREFKYDLIKRVTGFAEQELLSQLSALKDTELLYERGIYPQSTYIFKHALIQDAAYQSLLKSTRQKHHETIARVLEENFAKTVEVQPELLGHHFTKAGLTEKAIPYWQRAGEMAIQRSAHVEAISNLTTGLDLLIALPDSPERTQQELDMQIVIGTALIATKGWGAPEVHQAYNRARELCQQAEDKPQLFQVLTGLRSFYQLRADYQTAHELGQELLAQAQRQDDPAHLLEAHRGLGLSLFYLGELVAACDHLEQGIALYDPEQHREHAFLYGQDSGIPCLVYMSWALWLRGYPDQALQRSREALDVAHALSHPFSLAYALAFVASMHQFRQEASRVQEQAEALMALSKEQRFTFWFPWGMILRGWALVAQGKCKEGRAQMQQGLTAFQATGTKSLLPYFQTLVAEAERSVRHMEEDLRVLAGEQQEVKDTEEPWWEAELHRCKGGLLLTSASEDRAEAETCFHQALAIARRQQAKSLELRAAISLSRLWQSQGKKQEARQLLAPIYDWFTEGFDTTDLKDAKALLDELS